MGTRNHGSTRLGIFTVSLFAWALVLIPPTDAWAITFEQWATSQGWPAGHVMPGEVYATDASIDDLAGISYYDWTTTPTTYLELYLNQITNIESGDFTGLGNLTCLHFRDNQLTSLESGDFTGLENLGTLYLGGNRITSIESGDFTGLGNLTLLSLGDNIITSIESGDFTGLGKLTLLDLGFNGITSIESGAFAGLGNLTFVELAYNSLADLNLERADFSSLSLRFNVRNNMGITRVLLKNATLNQTALEVLVDGGGGADPWYIGIGELPGITELDLSGVDFSAITDLSPLYLMDSLTDLWLADAKNLDANALDVMLDNMAAMQDPSIEGVLYLTQADYNALNAAGGGKLATWDAEPGHHVEIVPEPGTLAMLAGAVAALGLLRFRRSGFPA